jgi:MYXO-CTERM domain-containing protein
MKSLFAVVAFAGLAATAMAQSLGYTVVYTDQISDTIGAVNTVGAPYTLVDFRSFQSDFDTRLAWITPGPGGALYVANGPAPVPNPTPKAGIYRIDNIFTSPTVTWAGGGDPLQNPVGIIYDAPRSQFIAISNPQGNIAQGPRDGIFGVSVPGATVTELYAEPSIFGTPRPRYEAGHHIVQDSLSGRYIVSCVNGGTSAPVNSDPDASTLWYFDAATNNVSLLADLSGILPGGHSITRLTGMATIPGDNDLFVADQLIGVGEGAIYRILRDDTTGAVTGASLVLGGLTQPEQLLYNPYSGKLIVNERANFGGEFGPAGTPRIFEMNLDGSNVVTLASGMHARGLYVIPAPAGAAVLGLAGLVAARRRRN